MRYGHLVPKIYPTGVFIQSIEQTETSMEAGGKNIITATLTNHTQQRFEVLNGAKGETGETAIIKDITASIDSGVGIPSVTMTASGAGAEKSVHFDFRNLKGEKGDISLTEDVKQHIDNRIAEVKMPLNPICAYDMADIQLKTFFRYGYFEGTGKYDSLFLCDLSAYKGKTIKISISGYRRGAGGYPRLYVFDTTWIWHWNSEEQLDSLKETTSIATVTIPYYTNIVHCVLFHFPSEKMNNTIVMTRCTFEICDGASLIDSSGTGSHETILGGVAQEPDNTVGSALSFNNGFIKREAFKTFSLQKTHSRWIKITGNNDASYLYYYGHEDFASVFKDSVFFAAYNQNNEITGKHIDIKFFKDKWVNLIVENSLQNGTFTKKIYIGGKLIETIQGNAESLSTVNQIGYVDMGTDVTGGYTQGSLAGLLFFDRLLTEGEIQWLSRNPYYPAKRYSLAEYKADENRALLEELKKRMPTP